MNELEQLKKDVLAAHSYGPWDMSHHRIGRALDAFIAGHEVVEVDFDRADPYTIPVDDRIWYASLEPQDDRPLRIVHIIVPRDQEPTLLEAAKAFLECCEHVHAFTGEIGRHRDAEDALSRAIEQEERDE